MKLQQFKKRNFNTGRRHYTATERKGWRRFLCALLMAVIGSSALPAIAQTRTEIRLLCAPDENPGNKKIQGPHGFLVQPVVIPLKFEISSNVNCMGGVPECGVASILNGDQIVAGSVVGSLRLTTGTISWKTAYDDGARVTIDRTSGRIEAWWLKGAGIVERPSDPDSWNVLIGVCRTATTKF